MKVAHLTRSNARSVAALFVETGGCYFGLPDVEPWDQPLDARMYPGPFPVVAHPPCERWGRFWFGGPQWLKDGHARKKLGDDGGCFASALHAVYRWGGVLEHPADSRAWDAFNIVAPPYEGGWVSAGVFHPRAFVCCVSQGHYGHKGDKRTWLYAVAPALPDLRLGPQRQARPSRRVEQGTPRARPPHRNCAGIVAPTARRHTAGIPRSAVVDCKKRALRRSPRPRSGTKRRRVTVEPPVY